MCAGTNSTRQVPQSSGKLYGRLCKIPVGASVSSEGKSRKVLVRVNTGSGRKFRRQVPVSAGTDSRDKFQKKVLEANFKGEFWKQVLAPI